MKNADPHRIALLRDLLMDYPEEKAPNHGQPPAGLTPDEEDAWAEDFALRYGSDLPLEGRYGGEFGRTDAMMVNPDSQAWDDVQAMGQGFNAALPRQAPPEPEAPGLEPDRIQVLRALLQRRG